MKRILFLTIMIGLAQAACKKTDTQRLTLSPRPAATPLDGSWRMIRVIDMASNTTTIKPANIPNDVDITFTSITATNGTFIGVTPTNQIWENDYSTGAGETLSIPSLGITKAWETDWGFLFVGHIRSALAYHFETSDILNIRTASKILVFRKLP